MGASVSCPQDFERGTGLSCRIRCPANFKYSQEGNTEKCVFTNNNAYSIEIKALSTLKPGLPEPKDYVDERNRFSQELKKLNERIQREGPLQDKVTSFQEQRKHDVNEYSRIQSEYATYSAAGAVASTIKAATDSLRVPRPPVAGSAKDIEIERKKLLESSKPDMLIIQIALAVVVLCLLVYIIVPAEYAHILAFLLLSVGVAVGIFLKK